ncbi:MAG: hypothetical protein ACI9VI_002299 [Candidatus Azotimanducaceae bacterium]|jgi:hypothetical protein
MQDNNLSSSRIHRIKCQGYCGYSDEQISELAFGNRISFILSTILLFVGVATANITILTILMVITFLAIILPNNPFDYIYNNLLSKMMNKAQLPPRSKQMKFTSTLATIWIGLHIYLFYSGYTTAGYISGGAMLCIPLVVCLTDFCLTSYIYNFLFKVKIE